MMAKAGLRNQEGGWSKPFVDSDHNVYLWLCCNKCSDVDPSEATIALENDATQVRRKSSMIFVNSLT